MKKIAIEYLFILRLTSRRMMTNKKSLCFVFELKKKPKYIRQNSWKYMNWFLRKRRQNINTVIHPRTEVATGMAKTASLAIHHSVCKTTRENENKRGGL